MARTIINWNDGFDACLKKTPGASGTTGTSQISHYGSDTTPIDIITSENQRFPGYDSYKVTIKPPQSGRPRSYASIDVPNIPADGKGLDKYYFNSIYLGDINNSKDWAHLSSGDKNATLGTAVAGFRYVLGGGTNGHNGPRGWLGLGPSGAPALGGGGTIITPGNYLQGSVVPEAPLWVRGRWIDSIVHVNWGARGTQYAGNAFTEVWFKFATDSWANATHGKASAATMYYNLSDFGGDANGASAYCWVGMYTGNGYFALGDPSMTCYHGPWVIGDSFTEVDLPTELSGVTPSPSLSVSPTSLSFAGTQGGANPAAKNVAVSITNPGTNKTIAAAGVPAGWTVTPSSLVAPGSFAVQPIIGTRTPGPYNNSFQVDPADPAMAPQNVNMALTVSAVTAPVTTATPTSLSFLGTVGNVDPAAQTVSVSVSPAPSSNNVTVTAPTGWQVAANPTTPSWQQAITVTQPATFAVKPVLLGRSAGTTSATLTVDSADSTAVDDTVALSLVVTPGTTTVNAIDVDDTTPFLDGTGLTVQQATFQGGQAVLALTTGATALVTHPANINMTAGAVEVGPINWAARNNSGTGEISQRLVVDWGSNNRAVLERRTIHSTASQTPTSDQWQLTLRLAGADVGPTVPTFNVSSILSGVVSWLKIALLSDGKTVSFQVADDTKAYVELATRAYPDASPTDSRLASATFALSQVTGTLALTNSSTGPFKGASVQPNPSTGGTPVLSNSALTWAAPGQSRSMPISDMGGTVSLMFLGTVAPSNRNVIPIGVARTDVTPERYLRIDATNAAVANQLQMRGTGAQTAATGLIVPRDTYVLIVCSWDFSDSKWSAHVVNMQTGAVQHARDFFTGSAQTTLTSGTFAASRLVVGAQIPGSGGFSTLFFLGRGSVFGAVAADVTDAAVEAAAGSAHISSRALMKTLLTTSGHGYEAKGSVSTAMTDFANTTPVNETLGERVTPSGTPVTDYVTVDVPYDPTIGTPVTPPNPTPEPPSPDSAPVVTGAQQTDATTGQATATVPTISATGWTPNTTPYGLWIGIPTEEGSVTYSQTGSWQATGVFNLTGLTLDTGYEVVGRYRDSSGVVSNFSAPADFTIVSASTDISSVTGLDGIRIAGGKFRIYVTPNAVAENVTSYGIFVGTDDTTAKTKTIPDKQEAGVLQGTGTTVSDWDGTVKNVGDKLAFSDFTGYDDTVTYYVYVLPLGTPPNPPPPDPGITGPVDGGGAGTLFTLTLDGGASA